VLSLVTPLRGVRQQQQQSLEAHAPISRSNKKPQERRWKRGGGESAGKLKKKAEVIETTWDLESESNRVEARPLA
jgi:hypothetical protein